MAKRFTDSGKWTDKWFRRLPPNLKLLWVYLCDVCDSAGVWDIDLDLFKTLTGAEVKQEEFQEAFGDRIHQIDGEKIWLKKFIPFQYGNLSPDCKPHLPVISSLQKQNLWKEYQKGFQTLEEKEKDQEKDLRKGDARGKPKRRPPPPHPPEVIHIYEFWKFHIKASGRKADALLWIERRGQEHAYPKLVMSVVLYKNHLVRERTEEKYFKECANFFGEDAAFEGFLPDSEFQAKYQERAEAVLRGEYAKAKG